ncbi:MAG: YbaB/EbfC family nucleoid-associated protein [Leptospirillia bacterium]
MSKKMMGQLMRQAQEMQQRMAEMQEEAARTEVEASAGGGMVTVRCNGKQEITGISIKRDVVDPDDVEMLQDLILAAIAEAQSTSKAQMAAEMEKVTGGLNIPGMGNPLDALM